MRGLRASTLTTRVILLLSWFSSPPTGSTEISSVLGPAVPPLHTRDRKSDVKGVTGVQTCALPICLHVAHAGDFVVELVLFAAHRIHQDFQRLGPRRPAVEHQGLGLQLSVLSQGNVLGDQRSEERR